MYFPAITVTFWVLFIFGIYSSFIIVLTGGWTFTGRRNTVHITTRRLARPKTLRSRCNGSSSTPRHLGWHGFPKTSRTTTLTPSDLPSDASRLFRDLDWPDSMTLTYLKHGISDSNKQSCTYPVYYHFTSYCVTLRRPAPLKPPSTTRGALRRGRLHKVTLWDYWDTRYIFCIHPLLSVIFLYS